jgi:hypothetical protein
MKSKIITVIIASAIISTSLFADSKALKPEFVDMILRPYFELQTALANDNLTASKAHASSFQTMLGHGPSFDEAPELAILSSEAQKIASSATPLATARVAFHVISKELGTLIEEVGTTQNENIYKMSCPMAFDGKGGEWLQNNQNLANPYFGVMMYRCGSIQANLTESALEKDPNVQMSNCCPTMSQSVEQVQGCCQKTD